VNELSRRALSPAPEPLASPEAEKRRAHRTGPFGVLDIGTTKIACLIGRTESDGSLGVLGAGLHRGMGVRGGGIVDLEAAERAIRASVGQAEDMADTRLRAVTVNLSCGRPESRLFNVQWPVGGRAVEESDIRAVLREARLRSVVVGRETIHALPLSFSVDGTERVTDPRGLYCNALTARVHLIDAESTALRSLAACMGRCDLGIEGVISAPMAAGLATLVDDERELGVTVIDMGGGTTGMAVFAEGQVLHTAQLPIGGMHVTKDLATLLSTTLEYAERLKTLYGTVQSSPDDEKELLPVPLVGEDDGQYAQVPRMMVVNIIRPRLEETFELVKQRLDQSGLAGAAGNRIVLTGGAAQMLGVRDLAARMLGKPVRLGRPPGLRDLPDRSSGHDHAAVVGLLHWAAGAGQPLHDLDLDSGRPPGLFRRIVDFLRDRM
jgi:cell division protein FtsA